ncbi:tRNA (guanosine(37)-N1)-methyltransferase TrmD [Candidatus Borkfalkia ceftriaxoniphila]|uniref:tRNA (guanine-N(1)-)-methyltransferase n=2 Tax=Candidatus Borkfalkia ceftriaxoniphila TaxID=2508949 RepID=A0A4Q2KHR5_9FIRM|nr:tRNA (guanosine(37)-N1)-methyltransferase TrmD [Candidatus Borkfalkia ceftriaxoniphila]
MRMDVLTLFPEMFEPLRLSILGRAQRDNKLTINVHNIRDYSEDKHKKCDDYPFGGGAGMVMTAQPIVSAVEAIDPEHRARRIFLSPKGETFRQQKVFELLEREWLILLCGHYEGVDERAIEICIDEEISIGDYVLTGGELPAMVVCDCVARYVDGVLNTSSLVQESFSENRLEYPQYTRPVEFRGKVVPEVLRGGNHALIDQWRREQSEAVTSLKRPDLLNGKE